MSAGSGLEVLNEVHRSSLKFWKDIDQMKHKPSKRSTSNKHPPPRSFPVESVPTEPIRVSSPEKIDRDIGSLSETSCLKPNVPLKSQKLLKRDLLRCSNQRPSLLGPQTLLTPRAHRGSHQTHSTVSTVAPLHHRSLSVNSHPYPTKIDRIGPWPDISINHLRLNGNDLLRPLKNFRSTKNPHLFSPKYYAALNETTKFQFHSSKRSYIEDYRKQKGYLLNTRMTTQPTSLSLSSSALLQQSEDDQLSIIGTFSSDTGNLTGRERSNLSLSSRGFTRSADDLLENNDRLPLPDSTHLLPPIPLRNNNNHLRPIRHTQTITLPTLTTASFGYINAVEKVYAQRKKPFTHEESKLYFLDGRQKQSRLRPVHKVTLDFDLPAAR